MKRLIVVVSLVLACVALLASRSPAQSATADATFTVNDQGDAVDANPGGGSCLTANFKCTLRAAIQEANAQYAANLGSTYTIAVPGGVNFFTGPRVYNLTLSGSGEDNAATG